MGGDEDNEAPILAESAYPVTAGPPLSQSGENHPS